MGILNYWYDKTIRRSDGEADVDGWGDLDVIAVDAAGHEGVLFDGEGHCFY